MPQVFPQNHDPDGESSVTGLVHSVESCGTVDGPGIRFVLFLSGCSLRCRYCHNPDTSYVRRGRLRSADDVLKEIARYRDFLQAAGGGVTLSGGDPLFQPDFAGAVLKGCRKLGMHTCLDTSETVSRPDRRGTAPYTGVCGTPGLPPQARVAEVCAGTWRYGQSGRN